MAAGAAAALSEATGGRRRLLADPAPLRESPAFRRLFTGQALANLGQQLALVAIGLQVYDLTRSSSAVGLLGLCGLVPLVVLGLYGGSLVDAHDRRRVALAASGALWLVSVATAAQAWWHVGSVGLLYALVALQSAAFAVVNPARSAIIAQIVPAPLLPAANALYWTGWTGAAAVGPVAGGLLVGRAGFGTAYTVDAVTYLAALWGLWRLPALPPEGEVRRAGFRSVVEGLAYLRTQPVVRMTFVIDLCAMVLAMPRALFPAIGTAVLGGGATTAGLLVAAIALGSVVAGLLSGPLGTVRRQGLAVTGCVLVWGAAVVGFGAVVAAAGHGDHPRGTSWLLAPALLCLVLAGVTDAVSAVFRQTILQSATPDVMRGRLQGVFVVVVAGGPRLGDVVLGTGGDVLGEGRAAALGGVMCVVAVLAFSRWQPALVRYDARERS